LGTDDAARFERYDRLVAKLELTAVNGQLQLRADVVPRSDGLEHRRLVYDPAPLSGGLGAVHGHIGLAEEVLGRVALAARRNADARRHMGPNVTDRERLLEDLCNPPGHALRVGEARIVVDQDRELVAAQASGHV